MNYSIINQNPWIITFSDHLIKIIAIVFIVFLSAKLIQIICKKILSTAQSSKTILSVEREKRLETVVRLVATTLRVFLIATAILMILREIGLDITPLLTGAGIAGVAVGFGAQSLVKDVISGFFLLIEDQIRVGDVIKVNSTIAGTVEKMDLRITGVRDSDGTLHIIPNGEIKTVSNMTYEFSRAVIDLPIKYQVDLQDLSQKITSIIETVYNDPAIREQLKDKPELLGITKFLPNYQVIEVHAKTQPHARWKVAREFRKQFQKNLTNYFVDLDKK